MEFCPISLYITACVAEQYFKALARNTAKKVFQLYLLRHKSLSSVSVLSQSAPVKLQR